MGHALQVNMRLGGSALKRDMPNRHGRVWRFVCIEQTNNVALSRNLHIVDMALCASEGRFNL